MGNAAKRPSVWRRARVSDLRLRRARGVRLAALAGVSGVLLLPPATSAQAVLLDDTPPLVAYSIDGIVGTNGWYRGSTSGNFVVVHWPVSDPDSPIISSTGCEPAVQIPGPSPGAHAHVLAMSRRRHHHGYDHRRSDRRNPARGDGRSRHAWPTRMAGTTSPSAVSFSGTDATSGVASCSASTYAGPDSASAQVPGTCTDVAGNVGSATLATRLRCDPAAAAQAELQACQARRRPQLGGLRRHAARAGDAVAREGPEERRGRIRRHGEDVPRQGPASRQEVPLHGERVRRRGEHSEPHHHHHCDGCAALTGAGGACHGPAAPHLDTHTRRELLQRAARPRRHDPQRLAPDDEPDASAQLGLPRAPLPPSSRRVPLVRLAGLRPAHGRPLRRPRRPQLVPLRCVRARGAARRRSATRGRAPASTQSRKAVSLIRSQLSWTSSRWNQIRRGGLAAGDSTFSFRFPSATR